MRSLITFGSTLLTLAIALWSLVFQQSQRTWSLDDFEDGDLRGASGLSWIVIADDLAGGHANVRLEVRPAGPARSRHVLRVAGTLAGGTPSFAGAWLPLERAGRNLDVSGFDGVRLRVKGPAGLDVGFRSGVANFMARIEAGAEWKTFEIPFSSLARTGKVPEGTAWNPKAAQVFGVTTPQAPGESPAAGEVAFELDDVTFYGTGAGPGSPIVSGTPTGLAVVPFTSVAAIPSTGWIDLGADPERDGKAPGLPDATRLEAIPSAANDMLWVRVSLREPPHDRWIGVNLALDVDGDPANGFAWWGANSSFKFDRLVTVWCFHVADGCQGYVGIADAGQAAAGTLVAGGAEAVRVAIDRERRAFVVGVARTRLGLDGRAVRLVAAVGSALLYADDVPGQGAAAIR
jgi:hypothetical protein